MAVQLSGGGGPVSNSTPKASDEASWSADVTGFAARDESPFVNAGVQALDDFTVTYDGATGRTLPFQQSLIGRARH